MSRTDDLIDLLKATNDMVLVCEAQNVRSASIQVDDFCELALKSFLQTTIANWDPTDGAAAGGRPHFKGFRTVADEVLRQCPGNARLHELLDEFKDRREARNHFFHDHTLSGLTVTPEKCLDALCDLYELLRILFSDFTGKVENRVILKTQIAVIRVKRETWRDGGVNNRYQAVLSEWAHGENRSYLPRQGVVLLRYPCVAFEFSAIYMDARGVYEALEEKGLIFWIDVSAPRVADVHYIEMPPWRPTTSRCAGATPRSGRTIAGIAFPSFPIPPSDLSPHACSAILQ